MLHFNALTLVHFDTYMRNSKCKPVRMVSRNLKRNSQQHQPFRFCLSSHPQAAAKTSQQLQAVPTTQTSSLWWTTTGWFWPWMDETSRRLPHSAIVKSFSNVCDCIAGLCADASLRGLVGTFLVLQTEHPMCRSQERTSHTERADMYVTWTWAFLLVAVWQNVEYVKFS